MAGVPAETSRIGTELQGPLLEEAISQLAAGQYGRLGLDQLRRLGLSDRATRGRVAAGRLVRRQRGVYAVPGAPSTREAAMMEAVLAYGRAAISHRCCLEVYGVLERRWGVIDVSVPKSSVRGRPGIRAHATTTLLTRDVTTHKGIPVTTVARALLDYAEQASQRELEKAMENASIAKRLDLEAVHDVLARAAGRRGQRPLAAVVRAYLPLSSEAKSRLEIRFLNLLATHNIPEPIVNQPLTLPSGTVVYPDFHWPEHKLILETDGKETHLTPEAFERDRRRDQQLTLMGFRCPRTTWLQLDEEPEVVVALVGELIAGFEAA